MMMTTTGAGVRICPGCGIIAPFAKAACSGCNTPFGPSPNPQAGNAAGVIMAPGRVGAVLFACIHECDFACSACGMRSPLGNIELGGEVECARCGLRQAFDPVQWGEALIHAHDVVDLSGPNPEGANPNPNKSIAGRSAHAKIGTEFTSSTKTQQTLIMDARGTRKHSLKTTVSPGHPLCPTCKVPLDVSIQAGTAAPTTQTRCPRCQDVASYTLPSNAAGVYPALRGVLSGDQRSDRPVARMTRGQGGVEALACPQCGAALAAGAGEMVKCTFCNLVARVPGRLARHQKSAGEPAPMIPFWVLFEGTSRGRRKLLLGKREDADDDDDDASDFESAPPPPNPYAQPNMMMPMNHPAYAAQKKASSMVTIIVVASIAFTVLIIAVAVGIAVYMNMDDAPVRAKPTAPPTPPVRRK